MREHPWKRQTSRVRSGINRAFRSAAPGQCLVPNCGTPHKTINAHSIQSSNVLQALARQGHVYMIQSTDSGYEFKLTGIKKASTFTGFCAMHDNDLFNPVDLSDYVDFDDNSMDQIARLSLRAVACEHWKKLTALNLYGEMSKHAGNRDANKLAEMLGVELNDALYLIETKEQTLAPALLYAKKDAERGRRMLLSLLNQIEKRKFHLSRACVFRFRSPPLIAAASLFPIQFYLDGSPLVNDPYMDDLPEVALNVLPSGGESLVVFLWHKRFDKSFAPFFEPVVALSVEEKQILISKMLFMHCENFAMSPSLVDSWGREARDALIGLFMRTAYQDVPYARVVDFNLFQLGVE